MTKTIPFRLTSIALLALGMTLGWSLLPLTAPAWAQTGTETQAAPASTTSPLDEARALYDASKFDDAVAKLRAAISSGQVLGPDALKAKELLGRSLVKAGKRVEAREAFKSLLRQDNGYRLDAVTVPPDEMEVFNLALKDVTAEQIQAGQRVPASLGFNFGWGSGDNKDFAEIPAAHGGKDKMDVNAAFGGSVRFPIHPRWSLDLELQRFRATDSDSTSSPNDIQYEVNAMPLSVSVYWSALPREKYRLNLFAGGGPMLTSRAAVDLPFFTIRIQLADEKVGTYFHVGTEGEYLLNPRLSVTGRAMYRYAKATGFFKGSQVNVYGPPQSALADRKVDFSGYGLYLGLRGYIGY